MQIISLLFVLATTLGAKSACYWGEANECICTGGDVNSAVIQCGAHGSTEIRISYCEGGAVLNALADLSPMKNQLERMEINHCPYEEFDVAFLAQVPTLAIFALESTNLSANRLQLDLRTNAALHSLALRFDFIREFPIIASWINELDLSNNNIKSLADSDLAGLPNLRLLNLQHNRLARVALTAPPNAVIVLHQNPLPCACGLVTQTSHNARCGPLISYGLIRELRCDSIHGFINETEIPRPAITTVPVHEETTEPVPEEASTMCKVFLFAVISTVVLVGIVSLLGLLHLTMGVRNHLNAAQQFAMSADCERVYLNDPKGRFKTKGCFDQYETAKRDGECLVKPADVDGNNTLYYGLLHSFRVASRNENGSYVNVDK